MSAESPATDVLTVSEDGPVRIVRLNRPAALNAIDEVLHWLLYCGPTALQSGQPCTVHARADRIGFEPSPEISVQFICTATSPEHSHLL